MSKRPVGPVRKGLSVLLTAVLPPLLELPTWTREYSVGKALAVQALGSEFGPGHAQRKLVCLCVSSAGGVESGGCRRLESQAA